LSPSRQRLDDLASADLLIHVIDAADANRDHKIKEVDLILGELGVTSMPQIRALNKIDLIANEDIWPANNLHPEIKISSETGEGLEKLKNTVSENLFRRLIVRMGSILSYTSISAIKVI